MWLYTTVGYFSIVQKRGQGADQLTVRARFKGDLEALKESYLPELSATQEQGGTDYAYRATVSKIAFARAMARIVADLTYHNFKDAVRDEQGYEREQLYHQVWNVMIREQERQGRTRGQPRQQRIESLLRDHGMAPRGGRDRGRGRGQGAEYEDDMGRWGERIPIRSPEERRPRSSMHYGRGQDGVLRAYPWTTDDEAGRWEEFDHLRDMPDDNA